MRRKCRRNGVICLTFLVVNGELSSLTNGKLSFAMSYRQRQAPLVVNECGYPLEFNPADVSEGGMMALWDNTKGGEFPWDPNYFTDSPDTSSGFDPEFIMQHATDSANTAGTMATGIKGAVGQLSQDVYEKDGQTILEAARACGKAGGVVTVLLSPCSTLFPEPLSFTPTAEVIVINSVPIGSNQTLLWSLEHVEESTTLIRRLFRR